MKKYAIRTIIMHKRGQHEERQRRIQTMISEQSIGTQSELVKLLKKEGFNVTQSSVSRDLEEIGVLKSQGLYVLPTSVASQSKFRLLGCRPAGDAMIVLKTEPGFASAVSSEIDRFSVPGIVGTLAGDDTIFVAVSGRAVLNATLTSLQKFFPL